MRMKHLKEKEIQPFEEGSGICALCFSPNGRSLAYTTLNRGVGNIRVIQSSGTVLPYDVTKYNHGNSGNSPDALPFALAWVSQN